MSAAETADALLTELNATMGLTLRAVSLALQRVGQNGSWVTVGSEGVQPNETVRLVSDGLAPFKTVRFFVARDGAVYIDQIATAGAGGGVNTVFAAPSVEGAYSCMIEVDGRTQASVILLISRSASPPPSGAPKKPGLFDALGDVKTIAIVGVIGIGLLTLGPSLGKIVGGLGGGRE